MRFNHLRLHSYAYVEPELFLTSDDIENELSALYERAGLPAGRLELQTGIKRRGFWKKGTPPSTIASQAAEKILKSLHIHEKPASRQKGPWFLCVGKPLLSFVLLSTRPMLRSNQTRKLI